MGGIPPDPTPPARFGQILPGGCPAKFGQIEPRLSGGPKLFKLRGSNFAGQPPGKFGKSSHAFLIAYEGQPDLAKFCPEAARQNLAKSSRDSLKISGLQKGAARSPAPTPPPPLEINELIELIELIELFRHSINSINSFISKVHSFPNGGDSPAPTPPPPGN